MTKSDPIPYHTCYTKPVINQVACNEFWDGSQKFKQGTPHPHIEGLVYRNKESNGTPRWVTPSNLKANQARARELNYQYYQDDPSFKKASVRKWQKANRPKTRAIANKRRGVILGADVDEFGVDQYTKSDQKLTGQLYAHAKRISERLGVPFHVDHVLPLALGGSNKAYNLQVCPASWNNSKGDRNTNVWGAWEARPDYSIFDN